MKHAKYKSKYIARYPDGDMTPQKIDGIHKAVVNLLEQEGEEVFGVISTDRGRYEPFSDLAFTYIVGDATVILNSRNEAPYNLPVYSFVKIMVASNSPFGELESKLLKIEGLKKEEKE